MDTQRICARRRRCDGAEFPGAWNCLRHGWHARPADRLCRFPFEWGNGWGAIHAFASPAGTQTDTWSPRQQVASRAPAALLLSQQVLYVANQVGLHQGVPRGTIEAFRVEPGSGRLTFLGRTPLSLAATRPRHMALSPDGRLLAVAAYGGGIYNLLPVGKDGSLGNPCGIFKDAGCGPHRQLQTSAHPHTLLFDSSGKHLLCSDFGSDRISVFAVADGRLRRVSQVATAAGGGPSQFVLHPAGYLYVSHSLANTIACYQYDGSSGTVTERRPLLPAVTVADAGSLALHPTGHTLYATDEPRRRLRVWHVDVCSGALIQKPDIPLGHLPLATCLWHATDKAFTFWIAAMEQWSG